MRVDLGRREALVAQQLLDDPQVGAALEQVRRERVAERVRRDARRETGPAAQQVEPIAQPPDAERRAAVVQEDLGRGRLPSSGTFGEERPAVLEIAGQGGTCRPAEQSDPLLAPLAEDPDLAAPEVERAEAVSTRARSRIASATVRSVTG